jgi:hypothetical protein
MIPPGHDAWMVGDEACVAVDFTGVSSYAEPASSEARVVRSSRRPKLAQCRNSGSRAPLGAGVRRGPLSASEASTLSVRSGYGGDR